MVAFHSWQSTLDDGDLRDKERGRLAVCFFNWCRGACIRVVRLRNFGMLHRVRLKRICVTVRSGNAVLIFQIHRVAVRRADAQCSAVRYVFMSIVSPNK